MVLFLLLGESVNRLFVRRTPFVPVGSNVAAHLLRRKKEWELPVAEKIFLFGVVAEKGGQQNGVFLLEGCEAF